MMGIKRIIWVLLIVTPGCSEDEGTTSLTDLVFVRFFLTTDNNNRVLEFPEVRTGVQGLTTYKKDNVLQLKIPVALSYPQLEDDLTVSFSTQIRGNPDVDIFPANTLSFNNTRLVDTIYVSVNNRWNLDDPPQIIFELLAASDPKVSIGALNNLSPNHTLTVDFVDPSLQYGFSINRLDLDGEVGEKVRFNMFLPNGYFPEEFEDQDIFASVSEFDYELERISETTTSIQYEFTLLEELDNDFLSFESTINLIDFNGYRGSGNTSLLVIKPLKIPRELSTNPASHFYNLDDAFHRTYGENWLYDDGDQQCEWSSFFAFSFPVVVDMDDENAILFDDMGTADPNDDVYHHAFRIGFDNRVNPSNTTNSFNLKRWFNNESSDTIDSPGFNINPALEFFPENGTSLTTGLVIVVKQPIKISSSLGIEYIIEIDGEGTYRQIEDGLFEIKLVLEATNDVLFGGTITSDYLLYNKQGYPEPLDLTNATCIIPIDL